MKKSAIPTIQSGNIEVDRFASAVKQNLDAITGQARNVDKLTPLPPTATTDDIITRLNELVARLQ